MRARRTRTGCAPPAIEVIGRRYLGVIHGFASMPYVTPMAQRALADVGADLKAALVA